MSVGILSVWLASINLFLPGLPSRQTDATSPDQVTSCSFAGGTRKIHKTLTNKLDEYREFRDIDWKPLVAEITRLQEEKQTLETASDVLKALNVRLTAVMAELEKADKRLEESKDERARTNHKASDATALLAQTEAPLSDASLSMHASQFSRIEALRSEALGEHILTVEACDNREQDLRKWLQDRIDSEDRKLDRLHELIINAMRGFREAYPLETTEMDVSMDAAEEYKESCPGSSRTIYRVSRRVSKSC